MKTALTAIVEQGRIREQELAEMRQRLSINSVAELLRNRDKSVSVGGAAATVGKIQAGGFTAALVEKFKMPETLADSQSFFEQLRIRQQEQALEASQRNIQAWLRRLEHQPRRAAPQQPENKGIAPTPQARAAPTPANGVAAPSKPAAALPVGTGRGDAPSLSESEKDWIVREYMRELGRKGNAAYGATKRQIIADFKRENRESGMSKNQFADKYHQRYNRSRDTVRNILKGITV